MKIQCSLLILEVDGKLAIQPVIPPGMEHTVAGELISHLTCMAHHMMDFATSDKQEASDVTVPRSH